MSDARSYSIIEPHPAVPSSHYIHAGRGGAGNFHYVENKNDITDGQSATGAASRAKLSAPPTHAKFIAGRGGAGNIHRDNERAIFSFDEELEAQRRMQEHAAPMYHIGRGGAGNAVNEMGRKHSSGSTSSEDSIRAAGRAAKQGLENVGKRISSPFRRP